MLILKTANSNMFNNVKMWYANEVWNASYTRKKRKKQRCFKNCVKYNG